MTRDVVPPLVGGLHCGTIGLAGVAIFMGGSSRRWSAGSIAAAESSPDVPARREVVPPLVGGLHCGLAGTPGDPFTTLLVVPPLVGGLHCGDLPCPI